jgi:hypothetical protein
MPNVFPSVDPSFFEPTEKQKALLVKVGKWVEGMTRDEASEILDTLEFPSMRTGLHKLKVVSFETTVDKDKKPKKDKDGNPAITVQFKSPKSEGNEEISDVFYYPGQGSTKCDSAFKLAGLRKAMGLKISDRLDDVLLAQRNYVVWGVVIEEHLVTSAGKPVIKNDKPIVYQKLHTRYWHLNEKPTKGMEGDPMDPNFSGEIGAFFVKTRIDKGAATPYAAAPDENEPNGMDDNYTPSAVHEEDAF